MSWRMSLLFKWLKSGFSRGDFGSLFIHELPALLRPDHCAPDILISLRKPLLDGSPDHYLLRYPIALQESLILRESRAHSCIFLGHVVSVHSARCLTSYLSLSCAGLWPDSLSRLIAAWLMPNPLISSLSQFGCCLTPQLAYAAYCRCLIPYLYWAVTLWS